MVSSPRRSDSSSSASSAARSRLPSRPSSSRRWAGPSVLSRTGWKWYNRGEWVRRQGRRGLLPRAPACLPAPPRRLAVAKGPRVGLRGPVFFPPQGRRRDRPDHPLPAARGTRRRPAPAAPSGRVPGPPRGPPAARTRRRSARGAAGAAPRRAAARGDRPADRRAPRGDRRLRGDLLPRRGLPRRAGLGPDPGDPSGGRGLRPGGGGRRPPEEVRVFWRRGGPRGRPALRPRRAGLVVRPARPGDRGGAPGPENPDHRGAGNVAPGRENGMETRPGARRAAAWRAKGPSSGPNRHAPGGKDRPGRRGPRLRRAGVGVPPGGPVPGGPRNGGAASEGVSRASRPVAAVAGLGTRTGATRRPVAQDGGAVAWEKRAKNRYYYRAVRR